jgi:cyclic pyranopterin phosphate synthase
MSVDQPAQDSTSREALAVPPGRVLDRLGRPLQDLRISVTDRCNFRCGYCMPRDVYGEGYRFLGREKLLSFEEIARLTALAAQHLGVSKVRLTGGEPLLRRELPLLVRLLANIDAVTDLTLTTNGYLLAEHAQALSNAGLRRVTVSLDALDPVTFTRMNGVDGDVRRVLEGIEAAERAGLRPIKINCVVVRGINEHAIEALARYFRGTPHIVRFIEYMDVGTLNGWQPGEVFSAAEIRERIERVAGLEPLEASEYGVVAERFGYRDGSGEVGIIASVTRPFCRTCSRARLSADGRLINCLFAASGLDLRERLRGGASDAELLESMSSAWRARDDRYSELRALLAADGRPRRRLEMYQIGG